MFSKQSLPPRFRPGFAAVLVWLAAGGGLAGGKFASNRGASGFIIWEKGIDNFEINISQGD